jgi:ABC-type branched-subunit amino acid transport system permease subunit
MGKAMSCGAVLLTYPLFVPSYFTQLLAHGLILSIFAMGLNLATGYTGLPSLGHAAFFGTGAYTTAMLATRLSNNLWLAIAMGVPMATLMAAIFAMMCLRTSKVYFLFITLALGQVFWAVVFGWRSVTGGDDGISGIGNPQDRIEKIPRQDAGIEPANWIELAETVRNRSHAIPLAVELHAHSMLLLRLHRLVVWLRRDGKVSAYPIQKRLCR